MRPPRLRCTLFPLIYPPHLLVLPATFGLHLILQTYPHFRALYVIPVRRTKSLLTASFRFHLTMDTLAVRLYTSSLPRRVRDFHPLERAHGAQTKEQFHHKNRSFSIPLQAGDHTNTFVAIFIPSSEMLSSVVLKQPTSIIIGENNNKIFFISSTSIIPLNISLVD